jgi:glutathione S-transferase
VTEDLLAGREWFFPHFTACDAHFFWCFRRALSFKLDLSEFRNCMAHFERMQERPSVKKLVTYEKQVMDAFAKAA